MKILAVFALLCAVLALTTAFPPLEEDFEFDEIPDVFFEVEKRDTQGWTKIGDRYFRYESRDLTWNEAEENCISLGGHLASIHSFNEYNSITSLVTPSGNPRTWLGGTDSLREGNWQWTDGTNFIYSNWCSGEPNNDGNQDCIQMSYTQYGCWDDVQCHEYRPSVCVKTK